MSNEILIEWAKRTHEREETERETREARELAKRQQEEEDARSQRVAALGNFLHSVGLELQFDQDFIRFKEYELRASRSRYGRGFALDVWAPAPCDIPSEEWDEPAILAGEMAYANVEISNRFELANWILNPRSNFPRLKQPAPPEEVPAYTPPPPPTTAEQLLSLIREIVADAVDGRFERLDNCIERMCADQCDQDRRIQKRAREISDLERRVDYP